MGAPLIQGSEGQYTGSRLPARPIAGQSSIRVVDHNGIAIDEPINIHHDIGAPIIRLAGKKDPCTTSGTHQIGEHPGGRLDVQVKLQMAPVFAPVMPQLVPGLTTAELPQIDQIAQRSGV